MIDSVTSSKIHVLIVEDEALLRMCAAETALEAGFEVLEAGDADQAIILLEAHSEIRLVFTDIDMPGTMDGLKLAVYVREHWPPVEIIITS